MAPRPDFAVYSPDHRLQLVVEVKGTPRSDRDWAAKLRRNLIVHGAIPDAPYFLLVLPDQLYLWSRHEHDESALPDFWADTKQVLRRYLARWSESAHRESLSERGLELAVGSWLLDLTRASQDSGAGETVPKWLEESGLSDRLRTGVVEAESAA